MNNERHFHGTSHLGKGGIDALVAANAGLPPIYDWEFFDALGHHLQYGMWLTEVQAERQGHYIGATRSSKIMFPPGSLENKQPGSHTIQWNAVNMPSGIYFYKLQTGQYCETKKLVLIK